MSRRLLSGAGALWLLAAILALAVGAVPAEADFGLKDLRVEAINEDGSPATEAGTHPYALVTNVEVNSHIDPKLGQVPDAALRDLRVSLPPGLVGNPHATPQCSAVDFATLDENGIPICADASAVGVARVTYGSGGQATVQTPIFNLAPGPGSAAALGFVVETVPVIIEAGVSTSSPNELVVRALNVQQALRFFGAEVTIWGDPSADVHDADRGHCLASGKKCGGTSGFPFLTLPRSCDGSLRSTFSADSWEEPGRWLPLQEVQSPGMNNCSKLQFQPELNAAPTTDAATSPSGLEFNIDVTDEGLISATGTAQADISKAIVALPQGMALNPSAAAGLASCSEAELARETPFTQAGEGCPGAAKVGEVEVETPLLQGEVLPGSVYVATQDANPFGSMLALYMVIKDPGLGILVELPGRIVADESTGQLTTTFGEPPFGVPQFPFSHLRFRFRGGPRGPLVTPPACGAYAVAATLYPSSGNAPLQKQIPFAINSGPGGSPCPSGSAPFAPGFDAGSDNNAAGAYSPFSLHLTRQDGEAELGRFSTVLPPGVTGKLAGLGRCGEAAIAAARVKSGHEEQATPSCPAGSRIGRTVAGAGVGPSLTWVPGSLYLAGPFAGAPLSVVAITPALAGPFDAGTVVIREALDLNPLTAEVEVDGTRSEPIPRILKGIPLQLRDLQVYTDRPDFTLNPTSCDPEAAKASLFSTTGLFAERSQRYQAAGCSALAYKPRLALKLIGGTKRNRFPALRATFRPRAGDANTRSLTLTFPHSAFLEQGHLRTICTRVQFAAGQCPKSSIYGRARAFSPLLDEPLEGNVYLRSSEHKLPDLVLDLHGIVSFQSVIRIDAVKGRLRSNIDFVPDVPISKVVLQMQGGKKGLIVNSENLCNRPQRAKARLVGQNRKLRQLQPLIANSCKKGKRKR
jgi:hypothetical protein